MHNHSERLKSSQQLWATYMVTLGCALVTSALTVSYSVLFSLGFGRPVTSILAIVLAGGLILLWGPSILITGLLIIPVITPLYIFFLEGWRWTEWKNRNVPSDMRSTNATATDLGMSPGHFTALRNPHLPGGLLEGPE